MEEFIIIISFVALLTSLYANFLVRKKNSKEFESSNKLKNKKIVLHKKEGNVNYKVLIKSLDDIIVTKENQIDKSNLIRFQEVYESKYRVINELCRDKLKSEYDLVETTLQDLENIKMEFHFINNKINYLKYADSIKRFSAIEKKQSYFLYNPKPNWYFIIFKTIFFKRINKSVIELTANKIKMLESNLGKKTTGNQVDGSLL
ncbi:hypothetical protein [Aquimarina rhabdastrellae]